MYPSFLYCFSAIEAIAWLPQWRSKTLQNMVNTGTQPQRGTTKRNSCAGAPFTNMVWYLIPAWISNHKSSNVWDEITYPFPNFNGCAIEVWE